MKKICTWVLVADSAHARLFRNDGPGKGLELIEQHSDEAPTLPGRELVSDRPGRTNDRAGYARHAMEPATDPRENETNIFCHRVVDLLSAVNKREQFDRLVLVAPPKILGELRGLLPKMLASRVTGELPKNLTKIRDADLAGHLGDVMVP
ncbi:MAG TPA: host attachment protein [Alphaproteobacteria bacterium]|nr:host attachment protein [Alphaproteobacteria bacterium]